MTCDMWHMTGDTSHMTCETWHVWEGGGVNILSNFRIPSSYCLWFMILWRFWGKGHSLNEWMNHTAVYRTAPATPGLLIISLTQFIQQRIFSQGCTKCFFVHNLQIPLDLREQPEQKQFLLFLMFGSILCPMASIFLVFTFMCLFCP